MPLPEGTKQAVSVNIRSEGPSSPKILGLKCDKTNTVIPLINYGKINNTNTNEKLEYIKMSFWVRKKAS